ncbi:MAG TPA: CPBP family intramembrane glutamic endopeptidase [Flavisolibacter sp.]|nr:CPBP family intramembrane glutamic endopeptidase [Flavisolibacter sp.]
MKKIFSYLVDYGKTVNRPAFLLSTAFTAVAIFINYRFNLNANLYKLPEWGEFVGWYGVFLLSFGIGHLIHAAFSKTAAFGNRNFIFLLLLAPSLFAWKMSADIGYNFSPDRLENEYWNNVVYWPYKVAVVSSMLYLIHRYFHRDQSFYGLTAKGLELKPYLLMLLLMLPLIALASTQPDFLAMYPRFQKVEYLLQPDRGWHKLLYELSYGSDFFSIELFFRGFLVLAFAKYVGKDAILPMAIFYCTIHFGKPLGECISSYFGGMILGVITYHTRSILGGFLVHVGIAWLMELGGSIGKNLF